MNAVGLRYLFIFIPERSHASYDRSLVVLSCFSLVSAKVSLTLEFSLTRLVTRYLFVVHSLHAPNQGFRALLASGQLALWGNVYFDDTRRISHRLQVG